MRISESFFLNGTDYEYMFMIKSYRDSVLEIFASVGMSTFFLMVYLRNSTIYLFLEIWVLSIRRKSEYIWINLYISELFFSLSTLSYNIFLSCPSVSLSWIVCLAIEFLTISSTKAHEATTSSILHSFFWKYSKDSDPSPTVHITLTFLGNSYGNQKAILASLPVY